MDELLEELDVLSELELGGEWIRNYSELNFDMMIWADLSKEERESLLQRASYLVSEGNRLSNLEL